jgi:hypothetical protein
MRKAATRRIGRQARRAKRPNPLAMGPAIRKDMRDIKRYVRALLFPETLDSVGIADGCDVRSTIVIERFRLAVQADTLGVMCICLNPQPTGFLRYNNTTAAAGALHYETSVNSNQLTNFTNNFPRVRLVAAAATVMSRAPLAQLAGTFYGNRFARDFNGIGTDIAITSFANFTGQPGCMFAPINNPQNCGARLTWFPSQTGENNSMATNVTSARLNSLSWIAPSSTANVSEGFTIAAIGALDATGAAGVIFEVEIHAIWEAAIVVGSLGLFPENTNHGDLGKLHEELQVVARELPKIGIVECAASVEARRLGAQKSINNAFAGALSGATSAMYASRIREALREADLVDMMQTNSLTNDEYDKLSRLIEWNKINMDFQAEKERENDVDCISRELDALKRRLKLVLPSPGDVLSIPSPVERKQPNSAKYFR